MSTLKVQPWYFGKLTTEVAHERLATSLSGTFLVRDNLTSRGSYVISVNENGMIVDYDVRKTGGTVKINGRDFADVEAVVGYYQKYPLDTLTLDTPCSKEGLPSPPISPSYTLKTT